MSTTIRPEVSKKNEYWIDKHRYYELKHFCLQYPLWRKFYSSLDGMDDLASQMSILYYCFGVSDKTPDIADARLYFYQRMEMVENAAKKADDTLWEYILVAVTRGYSYNHLKTRLNIPCCKENYYKAYRRFFYILSQERR